jgi:hypothetical protein
VEPDEFLLLLLEQVSFLVFPLHVKFGVGCGLAFFVQSLGLNMQGFKRGQLVFGQAPLGLVILGHVNEIAPPLDKFRLF